MVVLQGTYIELSYLLQQVGVAAYPQEMLEMLSKGVGMSPCARLGPEDFESEIESEKFLVVGEICSDM